MDNEIDNLINIISSLAVLEAELHYDSKYEPFSVYADKIKNFTSVALKTGIDSFSKGYQLTIEELTKRLEHKEDVIPYILRNPEKMFGDEDHVEQLKNNFGYTDKMVKSIFEIVEDLFQEKHYEKCFNILMFLVVINPFIPKTWLMLGDVRKEQQLPDEALYAYMVGINSAPFILEPYRQAINLCLSTKKLEMANQIIDYGIKLCENQLEDERKSKLYFQLKAIQVFVKEQKL